MPPDILQFRPLLAPPVQFSPPLTTRAQEKQPCNHKDYYCQGTRGMNLTKKKLIPILVLIVSTISILRLLSFTVRTSSYSPVLSSAVSPAPKHSSLPLSIRDKVASHESGSSKQPRRPPNVTTLTEKEFKVLSDLIALKSPCNLLIFGFQPQYLTLSSMNAAGSTIFLEDDHDDKISKATINSNGTQIYRLGYNVPAKEAYNLLKHARKNPACAPNPRLLQKSRCKLALKNLPSQVYEKSWDVIVVDGPSGDSPESPGRMAPIYTAGVLARAGNISDVIVHDVDRMIEKWFSWEFLCHENLLYSKGKLWHFRIRGHFNSTRFCPAITRSIEQ